MPRGSSILGAGANGFQDKFGRGATRYGVVNSAPNTKNGSGKKNKQKNLFHSAIKRKLGVKNA